MSEARRVSIKWQIVFAIFFPISIWAFYRIGKLKMYLLYVVVPALAISTAIFFAAGYDAGFTDPLGTEIGREPNTAAYVGADIATDIGFTILAVFLVLRWSREWNARVP